MRILMKTKTIHLFAYLASVGFFALCSSSQLVRADLVLVGDTSPGTFQDNGGDIGADLIIGVSGTGGLFMDLAPPLDGQLMPLVSDNGIIGNGIDAIGAAVFDDFGVEWNIDVKLSVGNEGQGFLDLFDSALVSAGTETIVGEAPTGHGEITVNGVGTLLDAGNLSVGPAGIGVINVNSRAALRSQESMIGSTDDTGDGLVTLTDRGTRWSVRDALTVGGLAGGSYGKIEIQNEALLQIDDTASMTINPQGTIDLAGGNIRMLEQTSNIITNNGRIIGSGFIDGGIAIGDSGELRNSSAFVQVGSQVTRQREHLVVSEEVTNNGTIFSLGGSMEFQSAVTNTPGTGGGGEIVARDAEMHFQGGLTNSGGGILTVGGNTTIHGTLNSTNSDIHVLAGSEATLVGDLLLSGGIMALTAGPEAGTLDVIGEVQISSSTELALEYSAGVFAATGDTYLILNSSEPISGTFSNAMVTDDNGMVWDIVYNTSSVWVTATGTIVSTALAGDFDVDGDVDGADFLSWQRGGSPAPLSPADLGDWEANLGARIGPLSAVSAVPEPTTAALVLLMSVGLIASRRK